MSLPAPKVSPFGEEFGFIEHRLRIESGLPSLTIKELYDVSLKPITTQFNNYVRARTPTNIVDAFIPLDEIDQTANDIISHGLKVHPKYGFTFSTGSVNIKDGENKILHAQIALCGILNYNDPHAGIGEVKYISERPTVTNLQGNYTTLRIGENEFVVFAQQQVRAAHIIRLDVNVKEAEKGPTNNVCENCHGVADLYCHNCGKKFCNKCFASIHKSNYLKDHKSEELETAITQVQKCPEHPDQYVQYYCMKCHKAVCMQCKVRGNHAHGEFAKHKLIPIDKAYHECLEQLEKNHPFFEKRGKAIANEIKNTEKRISEIEANQKQVEEEIMRIAIKAIEDARLKSSAMANEVKSVQIELQRKQELLENQKVLLDSFRTNGEPLPLLTAAYRNQLIEETIADNADLPHVPANDGKLVVYGRIDVQPPKPAKPTTVIRERKIHNSDYSYDNDSYTESTTFEERDPHYTRLEKMALRKQAKYDKAGVKVEFAPFEESTIVTAPQIRERLYLALPFRGVPEPHILYASERDGLNMHTMHKMIDGMGITCVIIKSRDQVFGGFAASKWDSTGKPKKDKSSTFLFNINKDAFIPYGGQSEDPCYMVATPDSLSFGGLDLKLSGMKFEDCVSELENSYGIGFTYGSMKAKEFLAGKHRFTVDSIEVWGFFSTD